MRHATATLIAATVLGLWPPHATAQCTPSEHQVFTGVNRVGRYMAMDQDTAIISNDFGLTRIYRLIDDQWIVEGTIPGSSFGVHGMGVSGDRIVYSQQHCNAPAPGEGVHVYKRNHAGTPLDPTDDFWEHEATLVERNQCPWGAIADIDGDTLVFGGNDQFHVYRFDGTAWLHEQTITDPDGDAGNFGLWGLAIDGDTIVTSDPVADSGGGGASGKVFVYKRVGTTWSLVDEVLPPDSEQGATFGWPIDVSGDVFVVGEPQAGPGRAFIYRDIGGDWVLEDELIPATSADSDYFGYSVSIEGDVAVVGQPYLFEPQETGAAYLFRNDNGVWGLEADLTGADAAPGVRVGSSCAVSADWALVGEPGPSNALGRAYAFKLNCCEPAGGAVAGGLPDADGDGIPDDWELNGIPYTDQSGEEQRYMLSDDGDPDSESNPNRKDIWVEVDAMSGLAFSAAARSLVVQAFDQAAPVTNPDESTGISLHVVIDSDTVPFESVELPPSGFPEDFAIWKAALFGTLAERQSPDATALLGAKAKAYRYCVIVGSAVRPQGGHLLGIAEIDGNDLMVSVKPTNSVLSTDWQAAIFMHELGHTLGLRHGGGDDINGKPNYPSIMNYHMGQRVGWNRNFYRLDYSRRTFVPLNELQLFEAIGIAPSYDEYSAFRMPFGVTINVDGEPQRAMRYVRLNQTPTDFGQPGNGHFQDGEINPLAQQDLNYLGQATYTAGGSDVPSPEQVLAGQNDWIFLHYTFAGDGAGAASSGSCGPVVTVPTDELTLEDVEWMDQNYPIPPCLADFDGDGQVGITDFLALLAAWGSDEAQYDLAPPGNGVAGIEDFLELLAQWGPCPL